MLVTLKSNAKINLGLNIVGEQENGYHLLDMIMLPISLCDNLKIDFKIKKGTLKIITDSPNIPTGKENIIFKIYELFYQETKIEKQEIDVYLEKKIPTQAGLGGGSSNGALFFSALNKFYKNPVTLKRSIEITKKIGADIPFFLINRPCRVQGIGDKLKLIENNIKCKILLIIPMFGIDTAKAYKDYKNLLKTQDANLDNIILGMNIDCIDKIKKNIENHLEQSLLVYNKNIIKFRERLNNIANIQFFMSGSGSCYYTFVDDENVDIIYKKIKTTIENCNIEICDFL